MDSACIGIIGGGFAGISAAVQLHRQGHSNFCLLEAKDRLGGRVHTLKYGNGFLELGAQFIHGQGSNPIYQIALQRNLLAKNHDEKTLPFEDPVNNHFHLADGTRLDPHLVEKTHTELEEVFAEGEEQSVDNPTLSVGGFVKKRFEERVRGSRDSEHIKKSKESLLHWRMLMERTENACNSMDDLSMNAWWEYDDPVGSDGVAIQREGYQGILDHLIQQIPPGSVRLKCAVNTIAWSADEVKELAADCNMNMNVAPKAIAVQTSDNEVLFFDYVIVTCPLGYLKKFSDSMFRPSLPAPKRHAIESLGFGTVNKIFLQFDAPFWDEECKSFQLVWHPGDNFKPEALSSQTVNASDSKWFQSLHSIDTVSSMPGVLIGWIPGLPGQKAEELEDQVLMDLCHELLVKFTGKPDIPRPSKLLRSKWSLDAFTYGSYSYIPKGFSSSLITDLRQPLPNSQDPRVCFAGEATNPHEYATTRGAYDSGREAAQLIMTQLSRSS